MKPSEYIDKTLNEATARMPSTPEERDAYQKGIIARMEKIGKQMKIHADNWIHVKQLRDEWQRLNGLYLASFDRSEPKNEAEKKDGHYFIAIQFDTSDKSNKVVLIDCGTEKKCSALEAKLNAHTDITMFAYDIYGDMNPKEVKVHIEKNGKTVIEMPYTTDTKKIHDKLEDK